MQIKILVNRPFFHLGLHIHGQDSSLLITGADGSLQF